MPTSARELREIYEASNLARVTDDLLLSTEQLSVELILRWHRELLTGIRDDAAGRFRCGDEWVRVGSHLGANPAFVADLVDQALARYRTGPPDGAIERVAWFHCEFEVIHPFVDGNGRIGRVRTDRYDSMTRLLALLVLETLHKRLVLLTSREVIPLATWAREVGMRGTVAANRAKRQTLPAFRMRDRWMISADHRE